MREREVILQWIKPGSRVLDLGCGDGALLAYLTETKQIKGYGLEISAASIATCISRGLSVIEQDFNQGLQNFPPDSFDVVLLTSALMEASRPDLLVQEMLRVGKQAIITFPNFGYWLQRLLLLRGRMPVSKRLPYNWYDTPNIHHCTIRDFEILCRTNSHQVLERQVEGVAGLARLAPNFWAHKALYLLCRPQSPAA